MAKKKAKKNVKQVEWASPPPSPKPAAEESHSVPEALPLSPETAAVEASQEQPVNTPVLPTGPSSNDNPVEIPTTAPITDGSTKTEDPKPTDPQVEEATPLEEEDRIEPEPKAELPTDDKLPKFRENPVTESNPGARVETVERSSSAEPPTESEQESSESNPLESPPSEPAPPVEYNWGSFATTTKKSKKNKKGDNKEDSVKVPEPVEEPTLKPQPSAVTANVHIESDQQGLAKQEPILSQEATPESEPAAKPDSEPEPELQPLKAPPAPESTVFTEAVAEPIAYPVTEPIVEPVLESKPVEVSDPPPERKNIEPISVVPAEVPIGPLAPTPASSQAVSPTVPVALTEPIEAPEEPAQARSPPKPEAVKQVIEDSRPSAPTPPLSRARPGHFSAFEDDEDEDSALIRPRLRGEALSRESSRGLTYPPPPSHNRGPFASRVPVEHYSNPPPPPPPGYHPRYYPPAAPPYYHSPSHSMSQSGGYPMHGPYSHPSHSSSPYQESWGQFPPTYPPYGSPPIQRQDSVGSRDSLLGGPALENGSAVEDDAGDVFSRIAQAIPDLHVLLAKYKETHGQLGVREELLRRSASEQQERLRAKDDEIYHLKERVANIENKHSSEASRLRLEIGNMEEQVKELKEQAAETEKFKKEAEETRLALEAAKASWEAKYKDLETLNTNLEKTTAEEKEKTQKEFEEWKSTTNTKHNAETIALAIQFDKKLKEADVVAENQRQEAAAAFVKEKDELRSEHQRQQRERDSNFDRVRKELETKLSTAQKDREEALKQERESREVWEAERETLTKAHEEDRDSLKRGWEEQRELLDAQYKKNKEESDKAWIELHADANRKAEEEKAKVEKLVKELEALQKKFDELKAASEKEKEIIRSVTGNLEAEKGRLEKLMECYGDIAEIKSKGDTYYLVSFSQLQKQILDLAMTHFVHLPVTPPPDVLEKIPPELPSFLGNTIPSRQLRSAYVAHIVSAMVTFRVFGPFLFSLGRRYDKADSLFSSMSNHIRDKSTRKEAIWRQQTLLAAFTSSGAKQRINTAAGTVVDEIVNEIKHFADPKEEEGIRIAVRRIVKLAAETWRFARLEREMITATMPAVHDEKHEFTGTEYWPQYKSEDTPIASLAGTAIIDERPRLLLRLFPVIHREPKHENLRSSSEERPDEGCIYHYGLALYDDARPVELRREELAAAGLPPISNASPTAADFPPPVIPPPRNPPPPTPEVGAETSASARSPPPSTPPAAPSESSRRSTTVSLKSSKSNNPKTPYARPLPGSIVFAKYGDAAPSPASTESDIIPPPSTTSTNFPPILAPTESVVAPPSMLSPTSEIPPLPAPTETDTIPPSAPVPVPEPYSRSLPAEAPKTPQAPEAPTAPSAMSLIPPLPAPTESAIIPTHIPSLATSPKSSVEDIKSRSSEQGMPTPPRSRAQSRAPSPLFAAEDEIEALRPHRPRTTSTSRRSAPSKSSNEELHDREKKADTTRRTSGYALSTKSSVDDKSQKSDRTERSERSRYSCESRSAAIKGLYPNSPLAGAPPPPTRTHSLRREKGRTIVSGGTWDTSSISQETNEPTPEPATRP